MFKKYFFMNLIRICSRKLSNETGIYALATGSQRSGLAVIRLSGKSSYEALLKMTNTSNSGSLEPRKMYFKKIFHPVTKEIIDKGLVVWFKGS